MGRRLLVIAASAALVASACSKSSQREATGGDTPARITATDSAYLASDTLHAGLNHVVFENHGSVIHECMFIRLPEGMSPADYVAAVQGGSDFPQGAIDCAGPGLTSPGERSEQWVSLEPGRYLLGCWFKGHLTTTRPPTLFVHGDPRVPVTPPREDAILRMIDFRFELVGRIAPGVRTLRVENVGPSMHEVDIYRLNDGRTIDDLRAWLSNRKEGPPPATVAGGALDAHDISKVKWIRRNFTPGHYVFWCEMPMVQDGTVTGAAVHATHDQAGMVMELDVGL